jgi:hypothetical protein
VERVDQVQTLEIKFRHKQYATTNTTRVTQGFIPWFNSPQRLAYVHVVEEATKALESLSTRSSSPTHHQGSRLEVSTKAGRVGVMNEEDDRW